MHPANFDRTPVGHDLRTDTCILRIAAPAEYRPILLQYADGVAMVPINDRTNRAANARRARTN